MNIQLELCLLPVHVDLMYNLLKTIWTSIESSTFGIRNLAQGPRWPVWDTHALIGF